MSVLECLDDDGSESPLAHLTLNFSHTHTLLPFFLSLLYSVVLSIVIFVMILYSCCFSLRRMSLFVVFAVSPPVFVSVSHPPHRVPACPVCSPPATSPLLSWSG